MRTDIIDISHWQSKVDFAAVVNSGVIGVIHKATEATGYVDPDYASRMVDALECGLLWSAYHFLRPGNIRKQMEHFLKVAKLPPGSRVCIDHEDAACPLSQLHDAVLSLQELDPTMEIAIYSGHLIKEQLGDKHDMLLAKTSLWLAQYTSGTPTWPKGTWKHYSLWQYTDTGKCPGVDGNCDLNEFNGTRQNCALWLAPAAETQPEPVEPSPESVVLHVRRGTRVVVNGVEIVAS